MSNNSQLENNLTDSTVLSKYKLAADILNDIEIFSRKIILENAIIGEICEKTDKYALERLGKLVKNGTEKGVVFPTCISTNNLIGHVAPFADDKKLVLLRGDVVKVDIGVHVDGYIAQKAYTVILSDDVITDRRADVVSAAYEAASCVLNAFKSGTINNSITHIIDQVAKKYFCNPVEGVLSHLVQRGVIDGDKVILNRADGDVKVDDIAILPGEVYVVDILLSSGEGRCKESDVKTTIFKRKSNESFKLNLKVSRAVLTEIDRNYSVFPFHLRSLENVKGKIGITEIEKHNLVQPFPVLAERRNEYTAQVKFTVMLLPSEGAVTHTSFNIPVNIESSKRVI